VGLFGLCEVLLDRSAFANLRPLSAALAIGLAATLPVYLHFAATRYTTAAARWGFQAAITAFVGLQLLAIGLQPADEPWSRSFVRLAAVLAVAVPAAVVYCQRAFRRRLLAQI
jgi:hypothetical protein